DAAGARVVRRRRGFGHGLVGGAAHDVRVRALEEVDMLLLLGRVLGQAEAELPVLGALVGEQAVERVHEHPRNQLPHDQTSMVSGRQATVLARGTCRSRAAASVACLTL